MTTSGTSRELERRRKAMRASVDRFSRTAPGGGIRVTINDDGPGNRRGFDRVFTGLEATIASFPAALTAALPAVRRGLAQNFATESSGYGPWPALAPRTMVERARLGYGPAGPILVRTGALRAHVLATPAQITRRGRDVELRIAPTPDVGGVPKYRALARGYGRLPARPMVSLQGAQRQAVTSAISRFLRTKAAAAGAT